LRREEVAQLAGMSATWYTWLEQKRPIRVSPSVLDNLARVLRLDPAERIQLFQLALRQPVFDSMPQPEVVSPLIERMLNQSPATATVVMGRRWDVLFWNRAARAFLFDFEKVSDDERNMLWLVYTRSEFRSLMVDWYAHFVQLVERLKQVSPEFVEWWPRHDIRQMSEGRREYHHPLGGRMIMEHATFLVSDNPELRLFVLLPAAEGNSIAKMKKVIAGFRGGNSSRLSTSKQPK
jgi:transcriptional regulator with XRE-family HTH domain